MTSVSPEERWALSGTADDSADAQRRVALRIHAARAEGKRCCSKALSFGSHPNTPLRLAGALGLVEIGNPRDARAGVTTDEHGSGSSGQPTFLPRRRFLKLGLAAGGLVLGVGGGGLLALRGRAPSVDGLKAIDAQAYRTLQSLVEVMLPKTDAIPIDATELDLPRAFDAFLADEPEHNVDDLQKALVLIEFGPLVFDRKLTTFSKLEPEARSQHWHEWGVSDSALRRQVSVAMRKFFNLIYFDRPEVWPHIGYPGPSMQRKRGETP